MSFSGSQQSSVPAAERVAKDWSLDDRRHYVAWSDLTKNDFSQDYWNQIWDWYADGGIGHVAAYLRGLDISDFDPKAPPPKTAAWWAIVDVNRAPEDVRGVAGFILPGDFVDVVLISEDPASQREGYSDILLHHVKVLAIDQLVTERPEQPTVPKAVTLEVTPEQAQKILLGSNVGKLSLILRQPGDAKADGDKRVTERDIGRNQPRPPVRAVPPAAPAPPPPRPVVVAPPPPPPPPATVKVTIVRGTKQQDYQVKPEEPQARRHDETERRRGAR
jgi:hypothetical protein